MQIIRIISGGQTGADRAGLDFAINNGIKHGGWCPKGRRSEDGVIPSQYRLMQTDSPSYLVRTELNVKMGDATIVFTPLHHYSPGSDKTVTFAKRWGKPVIWLRGFPNVEADVKELKQFLEQHKPKILNVAGSRESSVEGIHDHVMNVLKQTLAKEPQAQDSSQGT